MAHSVRDWFMRYRQRGVKPKDALWSARIHAEAERKVEATLNGLSRYSRKRVQDFVHDFIRGREVEALTCDKDSDFINEPERAARVHDAAEYGADGKTHAEVIEDWREAFRNWVHDKRLWQEPERFMDAVEADFTETEMWHEYNGSLHQEIG